VRDREREGSVSVSFFHHVLLISVLAHFLTSPLFLTQPATHTRAQAYFGARTRHFVSFFQSVSLPLPLSPVLPFLSFSHPFFLNFSLFLCLPLSLSESPPPSCSPSPSFCFSPYLESTLSPFLFFSLSLDCLQLLHHNLHCWY